MYNCTLQIWYFLRYKCVSYTVAITAINNFIITNVVCAQTSYFWILYLAITKLNMYNCTLQIWYFLRYKCVSYTVAITAINNFIITNVVCAQTSYFWILYLAITKLIREILYISYKRVTILEILLKIKFCEKYL